MEFEQLKDIEKNINKIEITRTEATRGHSRTAYYANLYLDQQPLSVKIITASGPTLFSQEGDEDEDKKFQTFLFGIKLKQLLQ